MVLQTTLINTVSARFFQPILDLFGRLTSSRQCPELTDLEFIRLGVSRVLSQATSGRDFLQAYAESGGQAVARSHFFETLKSGRRLKLCEEVNGLLQDAVKQVRYDPFAAHRELKGFDLHAGDGHYQGAASHEQAHRGFQTARWAFLHARPAHLRDASP